MSKSQLKYLISVLFLFLTFLFLFLSNLKGIQNNCFHATDFGIYQQAIYDWSWSDLNPYLTLRGVRIFFDHFDPIIVLPALLMKIGGYNPGHLIFFEMGFIFVIFVYFSKLYSKNIERILFCSSIVIFCKFLLEGLIFPIHPTTWSFVPLVLLVHAILDKKYRRVFYLSCVLLLFKEVFIYQIFITSIFFFISKKHRLGILSCLVGFLYYYFVFILRSEVARVEGYVGYEVAMVQGLISNPWVQLQNIFVGFNYSSFFKGFYPFVLPLILWGRRGKFELSLWVILTILSGYGIIHYITGQFFFHKQVPVGAILVGLITHNNFLEIFEKQKRSIKIILLTLFVTSCLGTYTKAFQWIFFNKNVKCISSTEKDLEQSKLLTQIQKNDPNSTILATGGVIPTILTPNSKIYQIGFFGSHLENYDFLILQRAGSGETVPLSSTRVEEIINICHSEKIDFFGKYYVLYHGPIGADCLASLKSN
jgi:hypothetical protein